MKIGFLNMYAPCGIASTRFLNGFVEDTARQKFYGRRPSIKRRPLALCEKEFSPLMTQTPASLSELWLKRGSLSNGELKELYQRVVRLLKPESRKICSNLAETPEECVQQFAMEKVIDLLPDFESGFQIQGDKETKAYIIYAFKRFVSDIRRRRSLGTGEDDTDTLPAPIKEDSDSPVEVLAAAGISLDRAVDHANDFVLTLSRVEMLMLYYHTCMDYDDNQAERIHGKGAVPLSELARRFEMKNYYRIATELGITGKRAGYVADFGQSKLGRWMKRCELRIDQDHWDVIKAMLVILCGVIFDADFDRSST